MSGSTDLDLLVVGCGPVGVMTALRAAQRGLRVVAVDRSTEIFPLPRAVAMDDEIQRVFHRAGLGVQLQAVSTPVSGAEFVDATGARVVGLDLPPGFVGALGLPPLVMFRQPMLESALRDAAIAAGVRLHLGVTLDAVQQADDQVVATVRRSDGTERELTARWLVGADGASSTVRKLLGVAFEDQGFDQPWLVVDVTLLDPGCDLPAVPTQFCDPDRVVTFIPGHGAHRRWEFRLHEDEAAEEVLAPERIRALLRPWVRPDQVVVDRTAVYRFHALVAERLRVGRAFLAGDAAHQMPPFNGQGMCTGIRDAENLAWKLALVAQGRAGDALLDTYDAERRPHAEGQVVHSADAGRLIDAIAAGQDVSPEAGYGGGRPFPHLVDGMLDGRHPLVGHPVPTAEVDGARLEDVLDDRFGLVGVGGEPMASPATIAFWDRLGARRAVVDADFGGPLVERGGVVVVRPDAYVAAVTDDLDATTSRLAAHLGVPAPVQTVAT